MSVHVLALDTTSELGSVAFVAGGDLIEEIALTSAGGFGHLILQEVEGLITRHGVPDAFAGASGPGSFTGVRVGLTAVKGLAEAFGKPVFGVSNLQALASLGTAAIRAPWIDARRGQIYGGLYDADLQPLSDEVVVAMEDWSYPPEAELLSLKCPLAAAIGKIAAARYEAGERPDPAALDANYVRRSDAELFWKEA